MQERARKLRIAQTSAERILWKNLKKRQIKDVKFRRQYIIGFYIVYFVSFTPSAAKRGRAGMGVEKINISG